MYVCATLGWKSDKFFSFIILVLSILSNSDFACLDLWFWKALASKLLIVSVWQLTVMQRWFNRALWFREIVAAYDTTMQLSLCFTVSVPLMCQWVCVCVCVCCILQLNWIGRGARQHLCTSGVELAHLCQILSGAVFIEHFISTND